MAGGVSGGTPTGPDGRGRMATSSASRPDIVALMLEAGQVEPGMRVLEIGTGYTAALLAHYLGAGNVTTIGCSPPSPRPECHMRGWRKPGPGDWCSPRGAAPTSPPGCCR
ncbi:MAG TPA: hypothetical protein VN327_04925 [Pseudonocardiaceae bacterium]|nr:hypothetical protein [Pseudonocardiaceae bacterium]